MKKTAPAKKNKSTIYFRYEFSDETGRPEGGDVFQFGSLNKVQEMAAEILKVAQSDQVTVNLTIGTEGSFFGFLKNVGLSRQDVEKEMVQADMAPMKKAKTKATKKTASKKSVTKKKAKKK
jgi:hypothetical protein